MKITGWRRLIFGLYTVTAVSLVEWLVVGGWSKTGAVAIVALGAFFYGERMVDSVTKLVTVIKDKFSGK
ncbi:MAG: hypothetical protein ACTSXE_02825 [Candidatus Thorarchaeota archaeon]